MDSLSALIKSKKASSSSSSSSKAAAGSRREAYKGKKKFLTRGEILRQQEEEEKKKKLKRKRSLEGEKGKDGLDRQSSLDLPAGMAVLPKAEVIKRLRALGQPITLFGETDKNRLSRLAKLEESGAQNEGLALQGAHVVKMDKNIEGDVIKKKKKENDKKEGKVANSSSSNGQKNELVIGDVSKMSPEKHIYRFLKKLMYEWGEELDNRPDEEKRKAQGKMDTSTYRQMKEYIKPLLKKLKTKTVEFDIVHHVNKIVTLCEKREYQAASDWYVRLAIGNAPWPIGVTMVGIHERSGRERIESSKVAHVMNDEEQRKYLTSVKRLMTFCQRKYPADPSKCVG